MNITTNRLASFALALWGLARIYQRSGAQSALLGLAAFAALLAIIWFSAHWAQQLQNSRAAMRALDRNVPPLAINLIGWLLLLLFCAAVATAPLRGP